ncbi:MAG: 1-phosphofructokinase family hexose kinase [Clostridiales bacterium]|nr:1-phosphofructokinase family hexose kinase [Clostridiales bacterium]
MNVLTVTLNPCIDKTVTVSDFEKGKTNRTLSVRSDIGGKGINVSRILYEFGVDTTAAGILAGDRGRYIEKALKESGIKTCFSFTDGDVRTNMKILDVTDGTMTEINERGFAAGNAYALLLDELEVLLPNFDIAVISGSIPSDLSSSVYAELISLAKSKEVKAILDADGMLFKEGSKAKPFAVKPNLSELENYVGRKLSTIDEIAAEAKKITCKGIELVTVSLGSEGAVFVGEGVAVKTTPFPIEVKSAAAAGDSMVGALIAAMDRGMSFIETAQLMTAAGTVTASKEGTTVATASEVFESYKRIKYEIL